MLVMGDGTGDVQAQESPARAEAVSSIASRAKRVAFFHQIGTGVALGSCSAQLSLFYTASLGLSVPAAMVGALCGVLLTRWAGGHQLERHAAASRRVPLHVMEEAQRAQLDVLERLRQISHDVQYSASHTPRPASSPQEQPTR